MSGPQAKRAQHPQQDQEAEDLGEDQRQIDQRLRPAALRGPGGGRQGGEQRDRQRRPERSHAGSFGTRAVVSQPILPDSTNMVTNA